MKLRRDEWNIDHLRGHLQAAAELEAWTIPYYMAAMFSVVDRSTRAYQLIQTVVNQEMLHLQLVSNVANAYGLSPVLGPDAFVYEGTTIPHLQFDLDPDNPTKLFAPFSAEIGPLDALRINGMCLVEYPEWDTGGRPTYRDDITEYGSIGEFYDAVEYGATQLGSSIAGGINQLDMFAAFYRDAPDMTVQSSGAAGLAEVRMLIDVIRDQGEAAKVADGIGRRFGTPRTTPSRRPATTTSSVRSASKRCPRRIPSRTRRSTPPATPSAARSSSRTSRPSGACSASCSQAATRSASRR